MPSVRRISGYSSIALLLLAFGLRVYHLDFQASLSDDALGLMLAQRNPLDLFSITATEPFPPTFYVTLSLWTKLAGHSEFAGRFYSLIFSVLSVAVIYLAGRRLVGGKGGTIAALLLAINPFDIFFAQEVRMYTMVVLFSLASSLIAYELITERHKWWIAYTLVSLLAAMTHAFALFVLFAQDFAALVAGPRGWRWLRSWAICQLAVVASFVIWISLVATKLQAYNNALVSAPPLPVMFWRTITAFALAFEPANGPSLALPAILGLLAAIGLVWLARRQIASGGKAFTFLLCYLAIPFFTVWAISLLRPVFYERYMSVALPPLLLLAAAGITALEQGFAPKTAAIKLWLFPGVAAAAVLAIAIPTGGQLQGYYRNVVYARSDDMRALASYVTRVKAPLVIVNVPANDPLYGYYLPPGTTVVSTLDFSSPSDLTALSAGHPTIWFLPFGNSDHQKNTLDWLMSHDFPGGSQWFGNAQVLGFGAAAAGQPLPLSISTPQTFGQQLTLTGATVSMPLNSGRPVDVTLSWQAAAKPAKDYSIFIHLLNGAGSTVSQHDGWPAGGARPTTSWQPGETITDGHALITPTNLPPGAYKLEVGAYDASGQRLALPGGQTSGVIGEVQLGTG